MKPPLLIDLGEPGECVIESDPEMNPKPLAVPTEPSAQITDGPNTTKVEACVPLKLETWATVCARACATLKAEKTQARTRVDVMRMKGSLTALVFGDGDRRLSVGDKGRPGEGRVQLDAVQGDGASDGAVAGGAARVGHRDRHRPAAVGNGVVPAGRDLASALDLQVDRDGVRLTAVEVLEGAAANHPGHAQAAVRRDVAVGNVAEAGGEGPRAAVHVFVDLDEDAVAERAGRARLLGERIGAAEGSKDVHL